MTPQGCQELSLPSLSRTAQTAVLGSQSRSCFWERKGHTVDQASIYTLPQRVALLFTFAQTETATREKEPGRWLAAPE